LKVREQRGATPWQSQITAYHCRPSYAGNWVMTA
jgi:hypothetical protein